MDRLTKMTIRRKIMLYPKLRNEVAEQIEDVGDKIHCGAMGGGKSSARKLSGWDEALIGVMSCEDYLWCKSIEEAVKYFNERGREEIVATIDELYWKCQLNANGVARKMYISRATVYNLVDIFMEVVHTYAIKNGLI